MSDKSGSTGGGKFAFREILGPTPQIKPGDVVAARLWLEQIIKTIEHGGWSAAERQRLIQLRRKWRARASGRDEYFNRWGNGCQTSEREQKRQREAERAKSMPTPPEELNELGSLWARKSSGSGMKRND